MSLLRKLDSSGLLKRILAEPDLPEKIQALKTHELVGIIDQVGLEDCAEIISCASLEQLEQVFDEDLWQANTPGGDELFDPSRFGLWLEVLLELGSNKAAELISNMDFDFLVGAISQLVWVIELEWLERQISLDPRIEKILDSTESFEVEDFVIFARHSQSWDAVITTINELDQCQHSLIRSLLERCAYLTTEEIEDSDGLSAVLTSEQQLMMDIAVEREERRKAKGYVPPHEARAYLKLAVGSLDIEDNVSPRHLRINTPNNPNSLATQAALVQIDNRFFRIRSFLMSDKSMEPIRIEQLIYLANVLIAGEDRGGQRLRLVEAMTLVLQTCEEGLDRRPKSTSFLEAFRAAWSIQKAT